MKSVTLASLSANSLSFVAPSKWLLSEARAQSTLQRFEVKNIPNGIDTEVFEPVDQQFARKALGVISTCKIIGFIADSISDPRKGASILIAAVKQLAQEEEVALITVGNNSLDFGDIPNVHLGSLRNDRLLTLFYSACDFFVCPSLQDNLPNTLLESIACGTPIVGFPTGGIPDVAIPGESGYVCPHPTAGDLAKTLSDAVNDPASADLRRSSRQLAETKFSYPVLAQNYSSLYHECLAKQS